MGGGTRSLIGAVGVATGALGTAAASRWVRTWGASGAERRAVLPGDDLVPEPADTTTLALGIDAPASEVWQWLVQIGQDRAGLYSYEWLDQVLGLGLRATDELREEWQRLRVGDEVQLFARGRMGLANGYSLRVANLDHGRSLVLRQAPPEHPWDAVWSFVIVPTGPERCRLVSRGRVHHDPGPTGAAQRLLDQLMLPVAGAMTRRMLLGIAERAERHHRAEQWVRSRRPAAPRLGRRELQLLGS